MAATAESRQRSDVAPLHSKECLRAGQVLARAFSQDPLWSELMPDPERRARMFAGVARMIPAAKGVAERTPEFEAVALWQAPGREIGVGAVVRSGFAPARWVTRVPWQNLKGMLALQRQVEAKRKKLMPEPHWRLLVIGVEPDQQHKGLGSALVRAGNRRADGDTKPIYVETNTEENVVFYERHGFEVVEKEEVIGTDTPMWYMVRRPAIPHP